MTNDAQEEITSIKDNFIMDTTAMTDTIVIDDCYYLKYKTIFR
jgi:hypothetical protein